MRRKLLLTTLAVAGVFSLLLCSEPKQAKHTMVKQEQKPGTRPTDKLPEEAIGVWTRKFQDGSRIIHIFKICPPNLASISIGSDGISRTGTLTFKDVEWNTTDPDYDVVASLAFRHVIPEADFDDTTYFNLMRDNLLAVEDAIFEPNLGFIRLEKSPCEE